MVRVGYHAGGRTTGGAHAKEIFQRQVGAAACRPTMRTFHRYSELFGQEAVLVPTQLAEDDIPLRQLTDHPQAGGCPLFLHLEHPLWRPTDPGRSLVTRKGR